MSDGVGPRLKPVLPAYVKAADALAGCFSIASKHNRSIAGKAAVGL